MSLKRYTEYQLFDSEVDLIGYRKSFQSWNLQKLLYFAFCGALISCSCVGFFLAEYRLEYIILIPIIVYIFGFYFKEALGLKTEVHQPEKLYLNSNLMFLVLILVAAFIATSFFRWNFLHSLINFN